MAILINDFTHFVVFCCDLKENVQVFIFSCNSMLSVVWKWATSSVKYRKQLFLIFSLFIPCHILTVATDLY